MYDVGEDGALSRCGERVGIGFLVRSGSNAEETVFGVDCPKSSVLAHSDPCDVVAYALDLISCVAEGLGRNEHCEVGLTASGGECGGDVFFRSVGSLYAENKHMLCHPALFSSEVGRDTERETFFTEKNVSAVTGVDGHDGIVLREVHDPSVFLVDVALCVESLDEIAVFAERVETHLADSRHDDHVEYDVDGVRHLDTDLGELGTHHAHGVGNDVHRLARHLSARDLSTRFVPFFGALPDVGRTCVLFLGKADNCSRLNAGYVVDCRSVQIAVGQKLLIELNEFSRGDCLGTERIDLLLRTVDPNDVGRRCESDALFDKLQYFLIVRHIFNSFQKKNNISIPMISIPQNLPVVNKKRGFFPSKFSIRPFRRTKRFFDETSAQPRVGKEYNTFMIYREYTIPLKQIAKGFSDGGEVGGSVRIERFGSSLTVRVSPFRLATLKNGTYACLITDGTHTLHMPISGYRGNEELDLDELCLVLYHKDETVSPVALATRGKRTWDANELLSPLQPKREETYDDNAVSEQNYYAPQENDDYYRSVKQEVEESFDTLPPFSGYAETLPSAVFVQTGEVLLGKLYRGEKVKYLLFGAKTREELPKEHRDKALFVPLSFFHAEEGYFLLFQSGETGQIIE